MHFIAFRGCPIHTMMSLNSYPIQISMKWNRGHSRMPPNIGIFFYLLIVNNNKGICMLTYIQWTYLHICISSPQKLFHSPFFVMCGSILAAPWLHQHEQPSCSQDDASVIASSDTPSTAVTSHRSLTARCRPAWPTASNTRCVFIRLVFLTRSDILPLFC